MEALVTSIHTQWTLLTSTPIPSPPSPQQNPSTKPTPEHTGPEPSDSSTESDDVREGEVTANVPAQQQKAGGRFRRSGNDAADRDAVAVLLGLSQVEAVEVPSETLHPLPSRRGTTKRAHNTATAALLANMTRKGVTRYGPGDNRVRPPKAATKLLPEAKWRHIRLPDVQAALEAEDVVVLWAHYRHPETLSRNKAEELMNFKMTYYDETELRAKLMVVHGAFELENLLKERYSASHGGKRARHSHNPHASAARPPPMPVHQQHQLQQQLQQYAGNGGGGDGLGTAAEGVDASSNGMNSTEMSALGGVNRDGKEIGRGWNGGREQRPVTFPPHSQQQQQYPVLPLDGTMTATRQLQSQQQHQQQQAHRVDPAAAAAAAAVAAAMSAGDLSSSAPGPESLFGNASGVNQIPFLAASAGLGNLFANPMMWHLAARGHMPALLQQQQQQQLQQQQLQQQQQQKHQMPLNDDYGDSDNPISIEQLAALVMPAMPPAPVQIRPTPSRQPRARGWGGGGGGGTSSRLAADRPGRPPSYDDMVRWCVSLKRCLWQHQITLTIEEAVQMVNDPDICPHPPNMEGKAKILVASTLRKRVLGIFKMTWSQVATDADADAHQSIDEPTVLGAVAIKLRRLEEGDGNGIGHCTGTFMRTNAQPHNIPITAGVHVTPMSGFDFTQHQQPRSEVNGYEATENEDTGVSREDAGDALDRSYADTPVGMETSIGERERGEGESVPVLPVAHVVGVTHLLTSTSAPNLPPKIKEILDKGGESALNPEDVYALLSQATALHLPLSTRPAEHPSAGSMFLFSRKVTGRFRQDGYDWKRRESCSKFKVSEDTKIVCYYVGGGNDPVHRRCYWLAHPTSSNDLVLVHYVPPTTANLAWASSDAVTTPPDHPSGSDAAAAAAAAVVATIEQPPANPPLPPPPLAMMNMPMHPPPLTEVINGMTGVEIEVREIEPGAAMDGGEPPTAQQLLSMLPPFPSVPISAGFDAQQLMASWGAAAQAAAAAAVERQLQQPAGQPPGQPAALPPLPSIDALHQAFPSQPPSPTGSPGGSKGAAKMKFKGRLHAMDTSNPDAMFSVMCDLHQVEGISKEDCATVCRLWMENALDDVQKKQLVTFIRANIEDEKMVADWVQSAVIKKNTEK